MPSAALRSTPSAAGVERVEVRIGQHPVIALEPVGRRLKVGLVLGPRGRAVDVSVQPSATCEVLADAATRARVPLAEAEGIAREALATAGDRFGTWVPRREVPSVAAFGGASFPMLAAAYDDGAEPLARVPRWAVPVLSAASLREAALAGFGDKASRPVVRALVVALRPPGRPWVDVSNLVLALVGRDVLEPDRIARVLSAERVDHPERDLPDPSTLAATARVVSTWGPLRTEQVLRDAAVHPDGLRLLFDTARFARDLQGHGPRRLPNRLADLHAVHRVRVPTLPPPAERPPPAPVPAPSVPRSDAEGRRAPRRRIRLVDPDPYTAPRARPAQRPHQPVLAAPPTAITVTAATPLPVTPALAEVHERAVGELTLVVPRTVGDLDRWGRMMSNCLGTYGPAVVSGQSTIIGVERAGTLTYVVEIREARTVRQFNGPANRPVPDEVQRAVIGELRAVGILAAAP